MGISNILSTKRPGKRESIKIIIEASCCLACIDKPDERDEGITDDEVRAVVAELKKAGVKWSESAILDYFTACRSRVRTSGLRAMLRAVEERIPAVAQSGMTSIFLNTIERIAVADGRIHTNELKLILRFRKRLGLVAEKTTGPKKKEPAAWVLMDDPQMLPAIQAMVDALHPLAKKVCFDLTCRLLATSKTTGFKDDSERAWDRAIEQESQLKDLSLPAEQSRFRWLRCLLARIPLLRRLETATPPVNTIQHLRMQYSSNVATCALVVYSMAASIPYPETGLFLEAAGFPSLGTL